MYKTFATLLVNTLIAFVLLNVALYPFFPTDISESPVVRWYEDKRWLDRFSDKQLNEIYPGLTRLQAEEVQKQTAVITSRYKPFVEFVQSPVKSDHMNISNEGLRKVADNPWPPSKDAFNVFVFGGSTTFGSGITDSETIPSHIQKLKPEWAVYNFGTGAYFSTQERIRFEQLLMEGHVPNLVIFIDGLNEFIMVKGETALSPLFRIATQAMNDYEHRKDLAYGFESLFRALPIWRAIQKTPVPQVFGHKVTDDLKAEGPIRAALLRYLNNMKMIEGAASKYGIQTLFVWQPIPYYNYPREKEVTETLGVFPPGSEQALRPKFAYPLVEKDIRGTDILWCADIQKNEERLLYVDHVHYSGPMSKLVAECILNGLATPRYGRMHQP